MPAPPSPYCGDGTVDDDETCDDGPLNGYGYCASDCQGPGPFCGDGVVDSTDGEVCDDGTNDELGGGCLPGCRSEDLTDELFSRDLVYIEIDLPPSDWLQLRHEYKTPHEMFEGTDCRQHPVASPYNWYSATVTVDGKVVNNTGLRKKGHIGSQSETRPSLKVKFSEFVPGQRLDTVKRFALNNAKNDPALMRSCLAYSVFRDAGIPAPLCTFAHLTVNDEAMGIYFMVEELKGRFLKRNFADATGNFYEGTACDFRPEFIGGFEQETNELVDTSRADLTAVYDVVQNATDENLESELSTVINIDKFYRFWATESLVWHRDGYGGNANNYFIYADPADGGKFAWIPWGPDGTFKTGGPTPQSVLASGAIANRLYAYGPTRNRYYQELDDLLANVWDPTALNAEVDRLTPILSPHVADPNFSTQVNTVKSVITGREAAINAATANGYPDWTRGMRSLPCRVEKAQVAITFTTTWNTLAVAPYTAGSGTMSLTLNDVPLTTTQVGARAGPSGFGLFQVFATTSEGYDFRFNLPVPNPTFFDPYMTLGPHPLVRPPIRASANQTGSAFANYEMGQGTLTFNEVGTVSGDTIDVTFTASLFERYPGLGL
jgi:hypothetical protein